MEHNCAIIEDKKAFRYRAAGIIVEEGCVLFARNDEDDYFYSVGGAVHIGETSEEAVKREIFEETKEAIDKVIQLYNNVRPHRSLGMRTPMQTLDPSHQNPLVKNEGFA